MKRLMVLTILALSLVSCAAPSTMQSPEESAEAPTATIQPTPRTLTQTGGSLIIPLIVGERVEIEVVRDETREGAVFSSVTDPYGNKIAQSAFEYYVFEAFDPVTRRPSRIGKNSKQEYPWRFAFIAATDGDYILKGGKYSTLKAVIYP